MFKVAKETNQKEIVNWCESYIRSKELNDKLESDLSSKFDKINSKKMKV